MLAILGAIIFFAISIMTVFAVLGLPLGEFTMGGQHKVLPKQFRIMAIISVFIQLFAVLIILQAGGFIPCWFSFKVTKYICIFYSIFLALNTFINFISKSKKEKYVMTPLSFIVAICFLVTALNM